jgi:hypothetical protein
MDLTRHFDPTGRKIIIDTPQIMQKIFPVLTPRSIKPGCLRCVSRQVLVAAKLCKRALIVVLLQDTLFHLR